MKKLYASILTAMLGCASLMAQEEETIFQFTYNGEVIPNGSVVNVSTLHLEADIPGVMQIYAMAAPIQVKNVSEDDEKLTLKCVGKDNYEQVAFCPNGNCLPWSSNELSTDYASAIVAGEVADNSDWLHVSLQIMGDDAAEYDGTVELMAYPTFDEENCATITVHFDTKGTDGVQSLHSIKNDQKVEVFNLCGKKIANTTVGLPKGIYIVRSGNTSKKMTVR